VKFKAHPDDPNAAGQAMNDDRALRQFGPMNPDIYDNDIEQLLGDQNEDIAIVSGLQHVSLVVSDVTNVANQGDQNLYAWAHKNNMDIVNIVINTRAVEGGADPSSKDAKYGHYFAIQLVRKNKGAPNEKVVAYYADSLAAGASRTDLIRRLLQALTPG
jgi:hypothetical protein